MFALLLAWALLPLAAVGIHAGGHGGAATGAFSSLLVEDQFQYFAWIRDAGNHVAISNLFDTATPHHVFVLPPFLLSGGLWRLGLPLPIAYHLWTVVAVGALVAGTCAYARRLLDEPDWRFAAALALVFGAPLMILTEWVQLSDSHGGDRLLAYLLSPLGGLWGYVPRMLAVAATAPFLLGVEGILRPERRRRGWGRNTYLAGTSALGAFAAWIHPWHGLVILLILIGVVVWDRFDRSDAVLAVPFAATAAPLAYYAVLQHSYAEWERASHNPQYYSPVDVLIVLGPFVALALAGVRNPGHDRQERMLLLWLAASCVAFLAPTGGRFEVAAGLSVPLAVLCVRGWRRLALPAAVAVVAAVLVLLGAVIPLGHDGVDNLRDGEGTLWLRPDDRAAMRFMEDAGGGGSVLADSHIATTTIAFTGRRMWAAHSNWSPDYIPRATAINAIVAGGLPRGATAAIVRASDARFLFRDCQRAALPSGRAIAPLVTRRRRFGCATVFELEAPP